MPKTTSLTPDLTYSKNIQMYVGQPVQEIKALNSTLDEKFRVNQANSDKLEILLKNTKLNEKDDWIKKEALNNFNSELNSIRETGNWENAGQIIRGLGKDFATDEALNKATSNKKAMDVHVTQLNEGVANGDYPQDYANFALIQSKSNYKGVSLNEDTGHFEGGYGGIIPPKYTDIADEMWKYAKDVQEEKRPLYFIGKDGKKDEIIYKDGTYVYSGKETKVPESKVYAALRGMITTNKNYTAQIDYEYNMNNYEKTIDKNTGEFRKLNITDLADLIENKNIPTEDLDFFLDKMNVDNIEQLTEEEVKIIHKGLYYNDKIDNYIQPSAIGQSYSKIDYSFKTDVIAKELRTARVKQQEEANNAVKSSSATIIVQNGGIIHNPLGLKVGKDENGDLLYDKEMEGLNQKVLSNNRAININNQILNDSKSSASEKRMAKEGNDTLIAEKLMAENNLKLLDEIKSSEYPKYLLENNKISKDKYDELTTGVSNFKINFNNNIKQASEITNTVNERINNSGETKLDQNSGYRVPLPPMSISVQRLAELIKNPEINAHGISYKTDYQYKLAKRVEEAEKLFLRYSTDKEKEVYNNLISDYKTNKTEQNNIDKDFDSFIQNRNEQDKAFVYYDFQTDFKDPSKDSKLSQQLSRITSKNLRSYTIFGEDGNVINQMEDDRFNDLGDKAEENFKVIGITDYIEGQGYMLKAIHYKTERNKYGKAIRTGETEQVTMSPQIGDTQIRNIIQTNLRSNLDTWDRKGGDTQQAKYGTGVELADAIALVDIEKQSNMFRSTKLYEGETQEVIYNLSPNIKAKVTKTIRNGREFYSANVIEDNENKNFKNEISKGTKSAIRPSTSDETITVYNDLITLENHLEKASKQLNNYDIYNKNISRTIRHNNLTAFSYPSNIEVNEGTVGKFLLNKGYDVRKGDKFPKGESDRYTLDFTRTDGIEATIAMLDEFGFKDGINTNPNAIGWSYLESDARKPIGSIYKNEQGKSVVNINTKQWESLTHQEKITVLENMNKKEQGLGY